MKAGWIIAGIIVMAVIAGMLYFFWKKRQAYSSIYYVNNYGRSSRPVRYHPVSNLTDEELGWLMRVYDNEIKTRYHKTAGGMLVENASQFQIQVERDLKNRRLSDEQINELTMKLLGSMERIERYDPERYQKMGEMRQKLIQLKNVF
jgi:hypothetical protein